MRSYRKAVILLVILGLLIGVYTFFMNKKIDVEPAEEKSKIFNVTEDKISAVTIINTEGKFVFVKKDKDWTLTSPQDFKADKTKIQSIVSSLSFITAEKVIDENATDLNQYGFNNPIQISIKYDDATENLEMGDMTPAKDAYYFRVKGSNKVYTISSYAGGVIKAGKDDLRDKSLFTVQPDEIIGLSMNKGDKLIFAAKKVEESQWSLAAPIEGNADASKIETILGSISKNASYTNFIEEKPLDLDKYGLKNPVYSVEWETASGKTKLLIGSEKEKGKELYAKLADKNEVFTIDETTMNFLDMPLKEIIEGFVYMADIQDVSKVVVEMDGKTTVSDVVTDKDDREKDKFSVDGKDANMKDDKDNSLFRKYFQALIGVTMDEIDVSGKPSGAPEITFTYTLKKAPGTMKVEFISKDQNYYYVVKNGKYANILVKKNKFDIPGGVRETQQKLLEAVNK